VVDFGEFLFAGETGFEGLIVLEGVEAGWDFAHVSRVTGGQGGHGRNPRARR